MSHCPAFLLTNFWCHPILLASRYGSLRQIVFLCKHFYDQRSHFTTCFCPQDQCLSCRCPARFPEHSGHLGQWASLGECCLLLRLQLSAEREAWREESGASVLWSGRSLTRHSPLSSWLPLPGLALPQLPRLTRAGVSLLCDFASPGFSCPCCQVSQPR